MEFLERRDHQVLMEYQVPTERWGHQDPRGPLVTMVRRVHQERKECLEPQDPRDRLDLLDYLEILETLVLMVRLARRERGGMMGCQEQEVPLEIKVHWGLPERRVCMDMMEKMGLRVRLACLEIQEILVYLEKGVHKVQGDSPATLAYQVQRATPETLENEV